MSRICPHCKRPMNGLPIEAIDKIDALKMPRKERLAVDALVMAYPRAVSMSSLEEAMFDDVGESIECAKASIMSHLSKLRKKLRDIGWDVKVTRRLGYKMVPLHAR